MCVAVALLLLVTAGYETGFESSELHAVVVFKRGQVFTMDYISVWSKLRDKVEVGKIATSVIDSFCGNGLKAVGTRKRFEGSSNRLRYIRIIHGGGFVQGYLDSCSGGCMSDRRVLSEESERFGGGLKMGLRVMYRRGKRWVVDKRTRKVCGRRMVGW
ncbi:hypothetical protein SARC_13074 [Sphaeroforma arctica JP610]|uniref:Uncharacterized protein n=1 Tax=Sphaeroforma arctica JP610 TaxID=667725 RepID=A0A0L0FC72_9EUKA|nr:hypothetical protein SARC_13074 [Sphaeroforma arctica JP610]KNC74377.1 hypothetical protein SARC_13074 [Sphaeroforma arctica JP610]|eukprot:XP_014148279.1 hypothetical protein SARC_13074 [Sphaeroforma arctica JP610]